MALPDQIRLEDEAVARKWRTDDRRVISTGSLKFLFSDEERLQREGKKHPSGGAKVETFVAGAAK